MNLCSRLPHPRMYGFFGMLAITALVFFGGFSAGNAQEPNRAVRTIRVVTDNNYPPYSFVGAGGILQGISIDQWHLWQKITGIRVEITPMDWASALAAMKAGKFDVIDTIFKTKDRLTWLDFTKAYARIQVPVFFNKEIKGITDIDSLQGFPVAAKQGDAAVDILRRHGVHLMLYNSYEAIVRAAKEHKVNVFVIDKPPALYFLYKYGIQDQFKESSPLYVGEFHRAVKKGNTRLLQLIEAGFSRMSPKVLGRIQDKWYGSIISSGDHARLLLAVAGALFFLILVLFFWNRLLKIAVEKRTRELKTSEKRYHYLFDAESDAIVVIDVKTLGHVEVNEAAVALYGYSHSELLASSAIALSAEPEATRRLITGGSGRIRIPLRYHRKKDGTVFPVELAASFVDLDGQRLLISAARDITERLKAEETLREHRRFLSDLIENSGAVVFVKDLEGRYQLVNRKWEEATGLRREHALGRTDQDLFPGISGSQFGENDLEVIQSGETKEAEEVLERADETRYFLTIKFSLRNEGGLVTGICGMATEITERKKAEREREKFREQLSQTQKMDSIGRLAGGIAHDFNNMLGVILGRVELALLKSAASDSVYQDLKEIETAARRSADLTRQMLAFARKQTVVPMVLDLNETVAGMLSMLRRLIGEDIDLTWSPGQSLWPVKMDPSQIDQILANLCANARDSIENVGKVVIRTENATIGEDARIGHEGWLAGDFVMLAVTDNGMGMDQQTQALLFEPFYTTKDVGEGTGLGLATVYGIVLQNQGFIHVESEPGKGTTLKIFFPRHGDPLLSVVEKETAETLLSGKETLLLVEDEPTILDMAKQMIEKIGYHVLTAGSPSDAIRLVAGYEGKIDLLMTDVIMPEMNGWELSKKLRTLQPGMKLLFTSGYTADAISQHGFLDESVIFIQKPFTMQALSAKLRQAIEHPSKNT